MSIPVGFGTGYDWRRELLQRINVCPVEVAPRERAYAIAQRLNLTSDRTLNDRKWIQGVDAYALRDRIEICIRTINQGPAFVIAVPYDEDDGARLASFCYEWVYTDAPFTAYIALAHGDEQMNDALQAWRRQVTR